MHKSKNSVSFLQLKSSHAQELKCRFWRKLSQTCRGRMSKAVTTETKPSLCMTHGKSGMSPCEKGQWSSWAPVLKAEKWQSTCMLAWNWTSATFHSLKRPLHFTTWETEKPSKRRSSGLNLLRMAQNGSRILHQGSWYMLDMLHKMEFHTGSMKGLISIWRPALVPHQTVKKRLI